MLFLLLPFFGLALAGPCDPPKVPIQCFAAQTIYTLDSTTGRCKQGLGCPDVGTFQSMAECKATCDVKPSPRALGPCDPPITPVQCLRAETIFTLNQVTGQCVRREGCPDQGTFKTMAECEKTCEKPKQSPQKPAHSACLRPLRSTVNCFRAETIFVYDHVKRACVQSMGCPDQGTFKTRELCDVTCTQQHDPKKRSCDEICAASSCLLGSWCGEDENGKCGCHKLDEKQCQRECATKDCPKGTTCKFAFGTTCACVHDSTSSLPCNDYCSRTLCMIGTECGERDGKCGCHARLDSPTENRNDTNCSVCRLVDCPGAGCGLLPDGTCGCLELRPEEKCMMECLGRDCKAGQSCQFVNGSCGCFQDERDELPACFDFCSRARCMSGTICGEKDGQCGCHASGPPDECASRPCGPCENCVPVDRRCIRAPCPQYDCIKSDPDNCIID